MRQFAPDSSQKRKRSVTPSGSQFEKLFGEPCFDDLRHLSKDHACLMITKDHLQAVLRAPVMARGAAHGVRRDLFGRGAVDREHG